MLDPHRPGPGRFVRRHRSLLACAAVMLAAGIAYAYALGNPFVYDDHRIILENRSLESLANWRALVWQDVSRPLSNLTYAVDYAIWGGRDPFGFHLTNLLLHLANVVLVFLLASAWQRDRHRRMGTTGGTLTAAVMASGLFAVHPALTQAVAYVSARPELLCTFWLLVALGAARRVLAGHSRWWAVATLSAWCAALASKEVAAVFPIVLLAYDLTCFGRSRRLWTVHLPLLGIATAAGAVRLAILLVAEGAVGSGVQGRFALIELDVFRRYLQLLVVPSGQTIFHAIAPVAGPMDPRVLTGLLLLMIVLLGGWAARRVQPAVTLGVAWFICLLLPSAVLVVLDRGEPMAEHRLYTASAGMALAVGALFGSVAGALASWRPRAGLLVRTTGAVLLVILAGQTMARTAVWRRPVSLWLEAAEYAPDHWLPRLALGEALHEDGQHAAAVRILQSAVALRPTELLSYVKLGQCQLEAGDAAGAMITFSRLRELDPSSPAATTGLGLVALRAGDTRLARRYFLETLQQAPGSVPDAPMLQLTRATDADPAEMLDWCEAVQRAHAGAPGAGECIARAREQLRAR